MTIRFYSSVAQQETLTGSISAATTAISVSATTGFPASTPYTLALDYGAPNEELVEVTNVAGSLLTVTRAIDGTSATTHNAGAVVRHVSSARDFADSRAHENASTAVHGITGNVVGDTDTQTLTNKTLGSGTVISSGASLVSPSITGTVTGSAVYRSIDINTTNPGAIPLSVIGAPSQSASLQDWQDSSNNVLARIVASGNIQGINGLTASVTNPLQVPLFIKSAPSTSSPHYDVQNSAGLSVSRVDSTGKFFANVGAQLVGDASPSTGAVTVKAGPASNNIQVWQNGSGVQQATMDPNGVLTVNGITVLTGTAWISFAPLWTSTGTAPSIGNGTLTGLYYQLGKLVTMTVLMKAGTTTTFGTGTWGFSYPPGRQPRQNTPVELTYCGAARGHSTAWYAGTAAYDQPTDSFRIFSHNATTEWSGTVPVTWAASAANYAEFTVTYETV